MLTMKDLIDKLRSDVEYFSNISPRTPKDFERLNYIISQRVDNAVSTSTLKRFWNYVEGDVSPSPNTLECLARFVGYRTFRKYCEAKSVPESQSGFLSEKTLDIRNLKRGTLVRLTWMPDRVCLIRYLGEGEFKVLESVNAKMLPGDIFHCALIMEGQPVYFQAIRRKGRVISAYAAGLRDGVRFILVGESVAD